MFFVENNRSQFGFGGRVKEQTAKTLYIGNLIPERINQHSGCTIWILMMASCCAVRVSYTQRRDSPLRCPSNRYDTDFHAFFAIKHAIHEHVCVSPENCTYSLGALFLTPAMHFCSNHMADICEEKNKRLVIINAYCCVVMPAKVNKQQKSEALKLKRFVSMLAARA